jgi:hypothetical protein
MMRNSIMLDMFGSCAMSTNLSLEEVAGIISDELFGGRPFGGKERSIWEEIPAVYIEVPIFGFLVVLGEGNNNGRPGNCFVLSLDPWGDFDRYCYRNDISDRRIYLDSYLYHLLKFGLRNYPEVEVWEIEQRRNKEYLFRLAEQVVSRVENTLNDNQELTGFISFKESVIGSSSLRIVFSNTQDQIVCSLDTHSPDISLAFQVKVTFEDGTVFELHEWKAGKSDCEGAAYEVSPKVFDDPESWGDSPGRLIANDLLAFFREVRK